ncbi:OmpA family protein [Vibrio alginolyticus]|uniref:OmpA family protein n=1 Tax=Vibrio alginolyticus TaxID=663 RepID=UPI00130349D8|nr:OmpA family protein [Vibrio alginolyticus]EGR2355536.1 OmpA family protein [Vibrio alginolyticus]EIL2911174.1 OmpA family protein [Vibrio alginolyticus]EIO9265715.1 OmpA family protein [Vibrio alginolyticus]EJG0029061.1 OmpA family protein [Vibrio alginolyticus]EJL6857231.1 OmpA family protein [Vibrio alginolyticus]
MNAIKKVCLFAAAFALSACTSKGSLLLGEAPIPAKVKPKESESVSQVVFSYASSIEEQSEAIVIFANGAVMAGLQPSQHVVLPVCNGNQSFQVTRGGMLEAVNVDVTGSLVQHIKFLPYSAPSGIRYEQTNISYLDDSVANASSRSFLVPRHDLDCSIDQPIEFNLSSESFFEFGGAQLMDVVQGDELQKLVDFIDNHKNKGLKVTVSGYTDHIGERNFNQKLSEERAQTVADYIISRGYDGPIRAFGFGSSEPIVECSTKLARKDLIRCLQPNRRVTVRIWQSKK